MAIHSITAFQKIPTDINTAWDFFSDPANLPKITPPFLKFKVTSEKSERKMYAGQIIEYKVHPVAGIPLYWMTEITHVQPGEYFIDEQRFGPYSLWHHQHHFKLVDGGIEMRDLVHYKLPFWFIGEIAHSLFVKKQLMGIFDFRFQQVEAIFGKWPGEQIKKITTC